MLSMLGCPVRDLCKAVTYANNDFGSPKHFVIKVFDCMWLPSIQYDRLGVLEQNKNKGSAK